MGNRSGRATEYTAIFVRNTLPISSAKSLREIHLPEVENHVSHVCQSSARRFWVSNKTGDLIQINKEGETLCRVAGVGVTGGRLRCPWRRRGEGGEGCFMRITTAGLFTG